MTRRVRPDVLRHRIVARLEREQMAMETCSDEVVQMPTEWGRGWRQGYLVGLGTARRIVREGGV